MFRVLLALALVAIVPVAAMSCPLGVSGCAEQVYAAPQQFLQPAPVMSYVQPVPQLQVQQYVVPQQQQFLQQQAVQQYAVQPQIVQQKVLKVHQPAVVAAAKVRQPLLGRLRAGRVKSVQRSVVRGNAAAVVAPIAVGY